MSDTKKKLLLVLLIGVVCFVISCFFFQIVIVDGISMEPALKDKQVVVIRKYDKTYEVGDIIVFKNSNKILIKRINRIEEDGTFYVLGDNLDNSIDSRSDEIGTVNKEDILGIVCGY